VSGAGPLGPAERRTTVQATNLGATVRLSSGANGTIHRLSRFQLPDEPGDLVFKEYRLGVVQVALAGLDKIVRVRLSLAAQRRALLDEMTAWPLRTVVGPANDPLGVLMRLIPDRYFEEMRLPSGRRARVAREIQHLIYDPVAGRRHQVDVPADGDMRSRLQICEQFALIVSLLHGANLVYGDISARNVLYTLRPQPTVFLVDCDAARVRGSAAVNKQQNSPDWDAPHATTQNRETDRYKLALFILRCLTPGKGSSLNRQWSSASVVLDRRGLELLRAGLAGPPEQRPLAREWLLYLRGLLGTAPMPLTGVTTRPLPPPVPPRQSGWRRSANGTWVPV
jgi:hypothetical protein